MLVRDSWLWQVLFYGGLLATTLSTLSDPTVYGIPVALMPYIRLVSLVATVIGGKLGLSPLPKSGDEGTVVRPSRFTSVLLLLVVPWVMLGCGPTTKPSLVKTDYALYQAVQALSDTEIALSRAGLLTPAQSLRINEALLPAAKLGLAGTQALRAWRPGQPLPPQIPSLVQALGEVSRVVIEAVSAPGARAPLLEKLALAQQAILVIVALGGVS
jgi:hypothetical protein